MGRNQQLALHLSSGALVIDPLTVDELPRRESLMEQHGIGRGEAACLVLVERYRAQGVFLSSDEPACKVANALGLPHLTLPQVLEMWVGRVRPRVDQFEALIGGMRLAKFGLKPALIERLRQILGGQ